MTYKIAKQVLNDADKQRLMCCFFHYKNDGKIDWATAANDFGSASANSMQTMVYSALKKIRDAESKGAQQVKRGSARTKASKPLIKGSKKNETSKKTARGSVGCIQSSDSEEDDGLRDLDKEHIGLSGESDQEDTKDYELETTISMDNDDTVA